jgi:hypothetical protein
MPGYVDESLVRRGFGEKNVACLRNPFAYVLGRKVREVLGSLSVTLSRCEATNAGCGPCALLHLSKHPIHFA